MEIKKGARGMKLPQRGRRDGLFFFGAEQITNAIFYFWNEQRGLTRPTFICSISLEIRCSEFLAQRSGCLWLKRL
jgi:hypothetical protein